MKKITLFMLIAFTISSHAQNKLLSSINQYYDGRTWVNSWGYNYEYDGNNNLISETYVDWHNGEWRIAEKVTYTYNASNKVIGELGQERNTTTNKLENSYRDTYSYTNGNFTGQVSEAWENSNWVNEWKNELTFNSNNLPVSNLSYEWDGTNWVTDYQSQFTYNAKNKLTDELIYEWKNSQWVNSEKNLYTYDANNKLLNSRYGAWDDFNNLYKEYYRKDYVLDASGNRISEATNDVDNNSKRKDENTYDSFSLMSNFANPFKDKNGLDYLTEDFPYVNKIISTDQYYYDTVSSSYKLSARTTYNYNSSITLSTEQPEIANDNAISVYPNPTTSVVNINIPNAVTIDKVVITDVTGKTVLQQNQNTTQINVEKLAPGLYIIEASFGKEKFTSKFIKK